MDITPTPTPTLTQVVSLKSLFYDILTLWVHSNDETKVFLALFLIGIATLGGAIVYLFFMQRRDRIKHENKTDHLYEVQQQQFVTLSKEHAGQLEKLNKEYKITLDKEKTVLINKIEEYHRQILDCNAQKFQMAQKFAEVMDNYSDTLNKFIEKNCNKKGGAKCDKDSDRD